MRFSVRDEATNLGSMLLRMRACSQAAIDRALLVQREQTEQKPVGEILVALRLVDDVTVKAALEYQRRMRNGEALAVIEELDRASRELHSDPATSPSQ